MKRLRWVWLGLLTSICLAGTAVAQTENGEWRSYGGDAGSTKYAPLDQINRTNVKNLRIAWRRPALDPLLSGKDPKLQVPNNFRATPLMIGGVLYSPNGVGLVEAGDGSDGMRLVAPGRERTLLDTDAEPEDGDAPIPRSFAKRGSTPFVGQAVRDEHDVRVLHRTSIALDQVECLGEAPPDVRASRTWNG